MRSKQAEVLLITPYSLLITPLVWVCQYLEEDKQEIGDLELLNDGKEDKKKKKKKK